MRQGISLALSRFTMPLLMEIWCMVLRLRVFLNIRDIKRSLMKQLLKIILHSSIQCLMKHFSKAYISLCHPTALHSTKVSLRLKDTGNPHLKLIIMYLLILLSRKLTMPCTIRLNIIKSVMLRSVLSFQAA